MTHVPPRARWVPLILLTTCLLAATASAIPGRAIAAVPDCPACVADFAIYDAVYEDDGVWEEEVTALTSLLDAYGWTYQLVTPAQINAGILGTTAETRTFLGLIAPGGWASIRKGDVTAAGDDAIRAFVKAGGSYVGFCAGAYWAAKQVTFASTATGGSGSYNKSSDYKTWDYDLKLLKGTAKGPFGWEPWDAGQNPSFQKAAFNTDNGTIAATGLPAKTYLFWYGGPFFSYSGDEKPSGWQVWAKAIAPSGTKDEASTGDGKPTIVRFLSGDGRVILFSYHPEILIGSTVDGVVLSDYFDETAMTWDTGSKTLDQVNIDSWNVVHAALQAASGQTVTPVTSLP